MPEPPKIDPPIAAPPSSVTWLPGSPLLWIGLAAATFALSVGLAFGLRGGDDDGAEGAAPSPAPATTAASPELPGTDPPLPAAEAEPAAQSPSPDVPEAPIPSEPAPVEAIAVEPIAVAPVAVAPVLTGFALPLVDVCISEFEGHLPGAERAYRNGTHEGLDFYEWASCAPASFGTAVLAAKGGVVVRADYGYQNLTADQFAAAEAAGFQGAEWLDLFRGRQVWIDHGGGVMTRFAHLSAIAEGIEVGQPVDVGQIVAFIGESGTPASVSDPGSEYHLHFEIRVGDAFLGDGLDPFDARRLYLEAFGLAEPAP